jgi:DNA/RNA-binding domain of Phe-tRNA-synthetase-like protein
MNPMIRVDPEIFQSFPGYTAFVIFARDIAGAAEGEKKLRAAETDRRPHAEETIKSHPHLAAWRDAYRRFGARPKSHLCSAEALLKRVAQGQPLPSVNPLVDLYNAISICHVVPVGGEDADAVVGDLRLRRATGAEPFVTADAGVPVTIRPDAGEVIWADDLGVTCRRWNWRQGSRTRITAATRNAFFVLDRLPPFSNEELIAAGEDLVRSLRTAAPGAIISYEILSLEQGLGLGSTTHEGSQHP